MTARPSLDPGEVRSLQRVTSADGFFEICALDHLSDFAGLLAADGGRPSFADVGSGQGHRRPGDGRRRVPARPAQRG